MKSYFVGLRRKVENPDWNLEDEAAVATLWRARARCEEH